MNNLIIVDTREKCNKKILEFDYFIIPLKYAKIEEEVIKYCHYSNLQLLKKKDNLEKGSNKEWELK